MMEDKTMKKTLYIFSVIALAFSAACNKVTPLEPAEKEIYSLSVSLPEVTKTSIGFEEDHYKIFWQNGDVISAGTANLSQPLSGITSETKTVTFTFSKAVSQNAFVRCPGVGSPQNVTIPASQTSVGGQYDVNANPLWGCVSVSSNSVNSAFVQMHNAMAMLKFQVKGTASLAKIELEALGAEAINGKFTMSPEGVITGGTNTGSVNTITFDGGLALNDQTATDIYIPVRPMAYKKGFKMRLYESDGKYMQVSFFKSGQTLTAANLAYFNINYAASREEIQIDALGVLGAVSTDFDDSKPAKGIRIGTYNVWSDLDRKEKVGSRTDQYQYRQWTYACDAVAATIASMDCDVICINELTGNTYKASGSSSLQAAVSTYTTAYTFSLDWPNEVTKDHWYSPTSSDFTFANGFIYKADVLTLNSSGMFWLNSDGKTGWGNEGNDQNAGGKRTCVWANFTQKSTGKVFYVATAHLSIESQGSADGDSAGYWNLETAKNLVKNLRTRCGAGENDAIILCGDMNSSSNTLCQGFNYIVNKCDGTPNTTLVFTDVRDYLAGQDKLASSEKGLPGTSVSTWNTASYIKSEKHRLDHIMFRNCSQVTNYKSFKRTFTVDADATNTFWYPSDHLPLSVDVVL